MFKPGEIVGEWTIVVDFVRHISPSKIIERCNDRGRHLKRTVDSSGQISWYGERDIDLLVGSYHFAHDLVGKSLSMGNSLDSSLENRILGNYSIPLEERLVNGPLEDLSPMTVEIVLYVTMGVMR